MKKTEFITFGTRQRLARQKYAETHIGLNGQPIKHTDRFKYLGVVLSFNDHISIFIFLDSVRMKVSNKYKILGMLSITRPSLFARSCK